MAKGEVITIYLPRVILDKLDEYAQSKTLSRGRAISNILIEYFDLTNLGGGDEGDGQGQ